MGKCELIKATGRKCSSPYGLNMFYFRDCNELIKQEIFLCQNDSNSVFGRLNIKLEDAKLMIKRLEAKRDSKLKNRKTNIITDRETRELQEIGRKIKGWYDIIKEIRNRTCRLCLHPLVCGCDTCKDRHSEDKVSSATVFSQKLYRRETYLFHKLCGRVFLQRFGINVLPSSKGQMTIEQSE